MAKTEKWQLNRKEVAIHSRCGGPKNRRKLSRESRAMDLTEGELTFVHMPTGIEVKGTIAAGHYTRKEFRNCRQQLEAELFQKLEDLVAKKLRIAGR